jgi:hypothetical protein
MRFLLFRSLLSYLIAIRHLWRQEILMWRKTIVQKRNSNCKFQILTKFGDRKTFVATIVANVATEVGCHCLRQLPNQIESVTQVHFLLYKRLMYCKSFEKVYRKRYFPMFLKGIISVLIFKIQLDSDLKNGYNKQRRGLFAYIFLVWLFWFKHLLCSKLKKPRTHSYHT